MSIRKFARRLLSPSSAQQFWKSTSTNAAPGSKLNLESLESREVPAITVVAANLNAATGIITVTNAGATDGTLTLAPDAGGLKVTGDGGNAVFAVGAFKAINVTNSGAAGTKINFTAGAGLTDAKGLQQITMTSGTGNDTFDMSAVPAGVLTNCYMKVDLGGGGANVCKVANEGVSVVTFTDQGAATTTTVTPGTGQKIALDFRQVTAASGGVAANLQTSAGGTVATYKNVSVVLGGGKDATNIIAVYGSLGNDNIIGNDQNNLLIGFSGNDVLIGNGGNDQLNADRDFATGLKGLTNVAGVATFDAAAVVNLTSFAGINTSNAAVTGSSATAGVLFGLFGFFSFGEGVAGLSGTVAADGTGTGADFKTANALVVATASEDQLVGGAGSDGLYGFNNSRANASGGAGDDVFSTNTGGLASLFDGGVGNDFIVGAPGFTLLGGDGVDTIAFVAADNNATQPLQSTAAGGTGNDTFMAAIKNLTLDAGEGTDNVTISNDLTDVLVFNGTTNIVGGVGTIPLTKKAQR